MKPKLDIGCGQNKAGEEYLGLDHVKTEDADVVHDLETSHLPSDDNRFEEALSRNCLPNIVYEIKFTGGVVS